MVAQLERLRLDAEGPRPVLDRGDVEVGLAGHGTDGRELVARHLDLRHARVGEGLESRVVIGACVPERHELA